MIGNEELRMKHIEIGNFEIIKQKLPEGKYINLKILKSLKGVDTNFEIEFLTNISKIYEDCTHYKVQTDPIFEINKNKCTGNVPTDEFYEEEKNIKKINNFLKNLGVEFKEEEKVGKKDIWPDFSKIIKKFEIIETKIGVIEMKTLNEIKNEIPERKYINGDILNELKVKNEVSIPYLLK
ncbi:unnamed protein product [Meloidogyne enterolobii]|uniref:Uncharacterized protein n=1 Tax=Meloidogyne enterolobii TaxID=390850 RepID=A0ACB0YG01_MELEN